MPLSVIIAVTDVSETQTTMIQARPAPAEFHGFDGTEASFSMAFKLLYAPLVRYACMQQKDQDEAEDIVQQLFVKLWQQRQQIQPENLRSYLYRSVYHECINRVRHSEIKATYMKHNARALQEGHQNSAENTEKKELELRVNQAIEELPEQCGKVFKLSRHHHLTYAEIATILDISIKTVENHMGKALSLMRSKLADYLIGLIICSILLHHNL